MKAILIECENCRAKLDVEEGARWVTCEYCHTKLRLQPAARPPPAAQAPLRPPVIAPPAPSSSSVARVVSVVLGLVLAGGGALAYFVVGGGGGGGGGGLGVRTSWEGVGRALLSDLNGDSVADPIGRVRRVITGDSVNLAAFDGKTGALLWEGERLGTYSETYQGKLSLAGSAVLYGSPQGEVRAFSTKDGKALWQVPVGEKVKAFCQAARGQVGVSTLDNKLRLLSLDDGTTVAEQQGRPTTRAVANECHELEHDRRDGDRSIERVRRNHRRKIDGMGITDGYQLAGGGPNVIVGYATPGTRVPKVAVLSAGELLWKSEVPGSDRMRARNSPPERIAFDNHHLAAVYWTTEFDAPARVALFRLKDGRRLWEATLPSAMPVSSVQVTGHLVLVSTWGRLTAFDPETGKQLYSIGHSMK